MALSSSDTRQIEWLRLTSPAVKQPKRPPLYSAPFIRLHGRKVVISVILEMQAACSSELTKYYCVHCHCSAVTMPIISSSYATLSTNELVVSVLLPLNSPCSFAMRKLVSCPCRPHPSRERWSGDFAQKPRSSLRSHTF